jgi:uncharacterized protein (TIGR02145 family)
MSKDLTSKHGSLVRVTYLSHYPKFEILFEYQDGTELYSGKRTRGHDINFLSLGYVGEGPRYAQHFLSASGYELDTEEIRSICPGDIIVLESDKAKIIRKDDVADYDSRINEKSIIDHATQLEVAEGERSTEQEPRGDTIETRREDPKKDESRQFRKHGFMNFWKKLFGVKSRQPQPILSNSSIIIESRSISPLLKNPLDNQYKTQREPEPGDMYMMPLDDDGNYGVCRIIRSGDPAKRDPTDWMAVTENGLLVMTTAWVGKSRPDNSDPKLREPLRKTFANYHGESEVFWATEKEIPLEFKYLGKLSLTPEELKLSSDSNCALGAGARMVKLQLEWNRKQLSLDSTIVDDIEVYACPSVTIGTQIWMTENLNVDKFLNGDPIPEAKSDAEWENAGDWQKPAWCYYDNDPSNGKKYGKLYNWYTVNDPRGLAPKGWHVPSDKEWTILTEYLGGESKAGGKLRSTSLWNNPNKGATNESGFSGLPGGGRNGNGVFYYVGFDGKWWSSSDGNTNLAWLRHLGCLNASIFRFANRMPDGLSVRCLRD